MTLKIREKMKKKSAMLSIMLNCRSVSLKRRPYKFAVSYTQEFDNVRIRICLEGNDLLCGAYAEASTVDRIQVVILSTVYVSLSVNI